MLDTVVLYLERDEFTVLEPDNFTPSARGVLKPPFYPLGGHSVFQCVLNPSKKKGGYYKPRLTLVMRWADGSHSLRLKIEFSAPKLLFGNNFDELSDVSFSDVVHTLATRLKEVGVIVFEAVLRRAKVSAIHYSKNIVMTDYTTCSMLLKDLGRIDVTRRLDLSKTDYRNEGHALRYHSNSFELAFYDKIKDLQQAQVSEKRAIENDNSSQLDLFKTTQYVNPLEVLRMEIRIGNRVKLKSLFKTLGRPYTMIFEELFSAELSQAVLSHYWAQMEASSKLNPVLKLSQEAFLEHLAINHPQLKPAKRLQLLGAWSLLQASGLRELRHQLGLDSKQWSRLKSELDAVAKTVPSSYNCLNIVREAIIQFTPVKLSDYQDTILCR